MGASLSWTWIFVLLMLIINLSYAMSVDLQLDSCCCAEFVSDCPLRSLLLFLEIFKGKHILICTIMEVDGSVKPNSQRSPFISVLSQLHIAFANLESSSVLQWSIVVKGTIDLCLTKEFALGLC